jgi:hypothetical protein
MVEATFRRHMVYMMMRATCMSQPKPQIPCTLGDELSYTGFYRAVYVRSSLISSISPCCSIPVLIISGQVEKLLDARFGPTSSMAIRWVSGYLPGWQVNWEEGEPVDVHYHTHGPQKPRKRVVP